MSKKVTFKENVSSITTISPLTGAVAFAMALPGLAAAETFNVSSQAQLDAAVTSINEQSNESEGGPRIDKGLAKEVEDEGDYSHLITFSSSLSGQTLDLPSLYIENGTVLDIDGSGAPGLTLNMVATNSNHIDIEDYSEVSISDVSLTVERPAFSEGEGSIGGSSRDAFDVDRSYLKLDNVDLELNDEYGNLRAIYAGYRSSVSIQDSSLIGGGIRQQYEGDIDEAYESGALLEAFYSGDFKPFRTRAIYAGYVSSLNISNTTITGFSSKYSPVLEIRNRSNSDVTISNSSITGNKSDGAPLIELYGYSNSNTHITASAISNNESTYSTLEIDGDDSDIYISNSSINRNTVMGPMSYSYGYVEGVVSMANVDDDISVVLGNVTIAKNKGAPALFTNDRDVEELTLAHVTIVDNDTSYEQSESEGGGLPGFVGLSKSTVNPPAVYIENADEVTIINSIISGNSGVDLAKYYNGSLELDYSLVGTAEGEGAIFALGDGTGNLEGVDPKLSSLSGSGFREGMRLLEGSPAIDAGTDSFHGYLADVLDVTVDQLPDQSGFRARVIGDAPDMGAFEWTEPAKGEAPKNPSAEGSKLFGNMGFGFLSSIFAFGWLRRKYRK